MTENFHSGPSLCMVKTRIDQPFSSRITVRIEVVPFLVVKKVYGPFSVQPYKDSFVHEWL